MSLFLKLFLVAVACCSSVAIFEVVQFSRRLQQSRLLLEKSEPYQKISGGGRTVGIFGDSTGVGTGATNPRESIAGRLSADYPTATINNYARNGLRTRELKSTFPSESGAHFDLVVIQIGGNDIVRFTNLSALERDLTQALIQASNLADNVIVLTSNNVRYARLFPWPLSYLYDYRTRHVREVFKRITDTQDATYVDLVDTEIDEAFKDYPERYLAPDFFHPSSDGYALWYEAIKKTMRQDNLL